MSLVAISETVEMLNVQQPSLTEDEKQFVVQFAFKTGDRDLTNKLIDELAMHVKDSSIIMKKYATMADLKPQWLEHIENLLVAIEMYRIEEEKAVKRLVDILTAYGIEVSIEEIKTADTNELKERVHKEAVI